MRYRIFFNLLIYKQKFNIRCFTAVADATLDSRLFAVFNI